MSFFIDASFHFLLFKANLLVSINIIGKLRKEIIFSFSKMLRVVKVLSRSTTIDEQYFFVL